MRKLNLDHTQSNIVQALNISDKKAIEIDKFISNGFKDPSDTMSKLVEKAIIENIVQNREQLLFLGMGLGVILERLAIQSEQYVSQQPTKRQKN